MADKKISALTGATTPLAGTEVLPIVQSGATVKVAVSDLTAGRAVTALTYNGNTITTGTGVLTLAAGKTLTASNTLTLAGTDATTQTFPTTSATIARTDAAQTFTGTQTFGSIIDSALTATQVTFAGTAGLLSGDANLTFDSATKIFSSYGQNNIAGGVFTLASNQNTYDTQNYNSIFTTVRAGGIGGDFIWNTGTTTTSEKMRLDRAGVVTMAAYGAGAATFSAAGVISSVSDETWKIKDGVPVNTDSMLMKLEPGYWFYNEEKAPIYGADRQLGFYAQNVNASIGPEAAPIPEEGKPWGYYDRSVLAVTVMSLQKALTTIQSLNARISALEAK